MLDKFHRVDDKNGDYFRTLGVALKIPFTSSFQLLLYWMNAEEMKTARVGFLDKFIGKDQYFQWAMI